MKGRDFGAALFVVILAAAYWQVRIIRHASSPAPSYYAADVYTYYQPMMEYGSRTVRDGRLPLWDPYQLCGEPFLATPYTGVFYPLNAVYLLFDTATAADVSGLLHMLIGALGMWLLLRHLGAGDLAGVCAAATFAWSGWLVYNVNQPPLFAGLNWIPWIVLALDRVVLGRRFAWLLLILTTAMPLLVGAPEILAHALVAGGTLAAARLVTIGRNEGIRVVLRRAGVVGACGITALLLCAAQIVPTAELLAMSTRAPGALGYQVARFGSVALRDFIPGVWGVPAYEKIAIGLLPVFGAVLAFGYRRAPVWPFALLAGSAALLATGGELYRLYHALPLIGGLFQRPYKFLDLWAFGLAVLSGLALERLAAWRDTPRPQLWRSPLWLAAVAGGVVMIASVGPAVWREAPLLPLALVLLVLFGLLPSSRMRRGALVALCAAQVAGLFFLTGNPDLRPSQQPQFYERYPGLLRFLAARKPPERIYPYPAPAQLDLVRKLGMMSGLATVVDYEAMMPRRYQDFFDFLTRAERGYNVVSFQGDYVPGPQARWKLMDLTGTRTFVGFRGQPNDDWMWAEAQAPGGQFRLLRDGLVFRAYERPSALPRAYLVPSARIVVEPEKVLPALADDAFDPRREVILEEIPAQPMAAPRDPPPGSASIVDYKPESVRIAVDTASPMFLVLTDFFYPGWKAFAGQSELPIYRANYLFRAVWVPPGVREVRFEYRPGSLRLGRALSAITIAILAAVAIGAWVRGGRRRLRPSSPERQVDAGVPDPSSLAGTSNGRANP